jgi:hypothetical protein
MIGLKKTSTNAEIPVFQKEIEVAQGGFILDTSNIPAGATVPAGSVLNFNESTRVAKVVKTATVHGTAGGSATEYQVKKNHIFAVGDNVGKTVGGAAHAITAINTSNAEYDVLTVGTTIGAAAEFDVLIQSSATGASAAALPLTPKGLLRSSLDVVAGFSHEVGAVIRGSVYARRIPGANANIKALLPLINFSESR